MNEITDAQIIVTLRQRAKAYNQLATDLENQLKLGKESLLAGPLTAEAIRDYLRHTGARVSELARHFAVPVETIEEIVKQPDSGIKAENRGWLKVVG